jgi:hypothetical protein
LAANSNFCPQWLQVHVKNSGWSLMLANHRQTLLLKGFPAVQTFTKCMVCGNKASQQAKRPQEQRGGCGFAVTENLSVRDRYSN